MERWGSGGVLPDYTKFGARRSAVAAVRWSEVKMDGGNEVSTSFASHRRGVEDSTTSYSQRHLGNTSFRS